MTNLLYTSTGEIPTLSFKKGTPFRQSLPI